MNLQVMSFSSVTVTLQITDMPGLVHYSDVLMLKKGLNTLQIPAEALTKGIYLLTIYSEGHDSPVTVKFIK